MLHNLIENNEFRVQRGKKAYENVFKNSTWEKPSKNTEKYTAIVHKYGIFAA